MAVCWKCKGRTKIDSSIWIECLLNSVLLTKLPIFKSLSGSTTSSADMNAGINILTPSKSKWNKFGELIKMAAMHSPHSLFEDVFNPCRAAK